MQFLVVGGVYPRLEMQAWPSLYEEHLMTSWKSLKIGLFFKFSHLIQQHERHHTTKLSLDVDDDKSSLED
jgi:hypothetical protein